MKRAICGCFLLLLLSIPAWADTIYSFTFTASTGNARGIDGVQPGESISGHVIYTISAEDPWALDLKGQNSFVLDIGSLHLVSGVFTRAQVVDGAAEFSIFGPRIDGNTFELNFWGGGGLLCPPSYTLPCTEVLLAYLPTNLDAF